MTRGDMVMIDTKIRTNWGAERNEDAPGCSGTMNPI